MKMNCHKFIIFNKWIKNNKWLIAIVVIFLLLNNLSYLSGLVRQTQDKDLFFTGSQGINSADYPVYLSNIEQGKQGHLFIKNLYNHEYINYNLISPVWYAIGQFSKFTHINNAISYHIFRIIFALLFIAILWWWIKKIFTDQKNRLIVISMVLFSNGMGTLFINFWPNSKYIPVNLTSAESLTWLNMTQGPVFILSATIILTIFALFIKAVQKEHSKLIWLISLLNIFLTIIHPFDLPIIITTLTVWSLFEFLNKKNKLIIKNLLFVYLSGFLSALYFLYIKISDPQASNWHQQNIITSYHPIEYIWGFGIVSLLFVLGSFYVIKKNIIKNNHTKLMLLWAWWGWIMIYLPLSFNRRLANAWHVPLVILSFIGLLWLIKKIKYNAVKGGVVCLFIFLLFFDNVVYIAWTSAEAYLYPVYHFDKQQKNIWTQIKNISNENDIILSRGIDGNILPGQTGRTVYIGHLYQTPNAEYKNKEVKKIWTSQQNINTWLQNNSIDYIFASRKYIPEFDNIKWLSQESYIKIIINNNDFILYQVVDAPILPPNQENN